MFQGQVRLSEADFYFSFLQGRGNERTFISVLEMFCFAKYLGTSVKYPFVTVFS